MSNVYFYTGEAGRPWIATLDDDDAFPVAGAPGDYEMRLFPPGWKDGEAPLVWTVDVVDDGPPILVAHNVVEGDIPDDQATWRRYHGIWITEVIDLQTGKRKARLEAEVEHILRPRVV